LIQNGGTMPELTEPPAVTWPTGGAALVHVDADNGRVTYLDRARPEDIAHYDRRTLRVTEVLLEEALDNVRDALHHRGVAPPTEGTRP
jgi:hypothetical protein